MSFPGHHIQSAKPTHHAMTGQIPLRRGSTTESPAQDQTPVHSSADPPVPLTSADRILNLKTCPYPLRSVLTDSAPLDFEQESASDMTIDQSHNARTDEMISLQTGVLGAYRLGMITIPSTIRITAPEGKQRKIDIHPYIFKGTQSSDSNYVADLLEKGTKEVFSLKLMSNNGDQFHLDGNAFKADSEFWKILNESTDTDTVKGKDNAEGHVQESGESERNGKSLNLAEGQIECKEIVFKRMPNTQFRVLEPKSPLQRERVKQNAKDGLKDGEKEDVKVIEGKMLIGYRFFKHL
ncbi:uncharacterized protein I303_101846 [Kwoniella dejecticola CBS 10117]|uniref:Uncharacterized protein n=1 Tax=Kwoniella dejecticola CBS 10117 TaxID=1296121 RepID=A0A1A6ACM4_9TREE|nr:uncharacterized protein I303_02018 [Kwoniella dejecticola CBS 10117]OBR87805.1 hypothetical protein I303_02018 [Kwoniella dejecticola CBS 10117]